MFNGVIKEVSFFFFAHLGNLFSVGIQLECDCLLKYRHAKEHQSGVEFKELQPQRDKHMPFLY